MVRGSELTSLLWARGLRGYELVTGRRAGVRSRAWSVGNETHLTLSSVKSSGLALALHEKHFPAGSRGKGSGSRDPGLRAQGSGLRAQGSGFREKSYR
jgi:hypothetical protein